MRGERIQRRTDAILDQVEEATQHLDASSKLYIDQVIAKKPELRGAGSSAGPDGVAIVASEPGETLTSGGRAEED